MNYRHHFHAGNFADVMKHALLVQLVRAIQKKDKGFLYLDTHAGRGAYDLTAAAQGDSLARQPEWPDGVGRLWAGDAAPEILCDYLALIRGFDKTRGNTAATPRFYPGSPWLMHILARPQDRLALCEMHPGEFELLDRELVAARRATLQQADGYAALRALLPPPERRALVLIDPPYEAQDEFTRIAAALREGLARLPGGVFAVWYPLTVRARADDFLAALRELSPAPALALELAIVGDDSPVKMKGCGLAVINPPWRFDEACAAPLRWLAQKLAQAPGGGARLEWIVPERA